MKVQEVLFEFSKEQDALLKISRVLPHLVGANLDTSPGTIAQYVHESPAIVEKALKAFLAKTDITKYQNNPNPALEAVIAAAYFLRNNQINQTRVTPKMLEDITGLPYDKVQQIAKQNAEQIQQKMPNFRANWMVPVDQQDWSSIPKERQNDLIVKQAEKLLAAGSHTVSAKEIASALIRSSQVKMSNPDSLERAVDRFLSSDDPRAQRLDLRRPVGRSYKASDDTSSAIRTW